MRQLARVMLAVMLLTIVAGTAASLAPSRAQAAPLSSSYCGQLGEYTAWHYTAGEWKRVLWVWNNGHSTPYPDAVIVYYNGQLVENGQKGVQTYSGPQVDQGNGWVGYFISKTWVLMHSGWDDDWRWDVRGCVTS